MRQDWRMPRKKTGESKVTHFRLTDKELGDFIAAATRLKQSRSDLLRRAVRDIIGRPADLLDQELAALAEAAFQLKAIGRNLNQLARAVHIEKVKELEPGALAGLSASVSALDGRVSELVKKGRLRRVVR